MNQTTINLGQLANQARQAARQLAAASPAARNRALLGLAQRLRQQQEAILATNQLDLEAATQTGLSGPRLDRLRLTPAVLATLIEGLHQVMAMPDPIGEIEQLQVRPNGLQVGQMRIPLGVVGFIYESRPNATVEAASLTLKSGNAILLRGGKEALRSNQLLVQLFQEALIEAQLPVEAVLMVPTTDRGAIVEMCHLGGQLDLLIPRGGRELIELVQREARMPVLAHAEGVNHLYVDQGADLEMGLALIHNSKVQRPGTCNSLEKVLVHRSEAAQLLPLLASRMARAGVEMRGCTRSLEIIPSWKAATPADWSTEYLDLILTVKVVDSLEEALSHIGQYGSRHTEAIVTPHQAHVWQFLREVDASLVLVNASTRFNDGFELGLGAEIGISTSKLHAYGAMGVRELTTRKWVALGQGQVRD